MTFDFSGGFAVHLKHGMSKVKAVLLNLFADCFSFAGVYLGILMSDDGHCPVHMLAAITGIFIYLALVHLVCCDFVCSSVWCCFKKMLETKMLLSQWTVWSPEKYFIKDFAQGLKGLIFDHLLNTYKNTFSDEN